MLDQAFEALKAYDWGTDRNVLKPIDDAVIAAHGNEAARRDLEARLAATLTTGLTRDGKDYVCRKLMLIGTAASAPALAQLLPEKDYSHMARFALERIPGPEAAAALRDALGKLNGALKLGMIASLGSRSDAASVPVLAKVLGDSDPAVARAAAIALGNIRTVEAAQALTTAKPVAAGVESALNDARFACAEGLLAANHKAEAKAIYKSLSGEERPKFVRLAAIRGMLACAAKKV